MIGSSNPFLASDNSKSTKDVVTDFLQTIVLALTFSLILYLVFLVPSIVDGPSMEPSFYDNELLFANKTVQWIGNTSFGENYDYKRGDVIIFRHLETNLIKRIIAVEGDTVRISSGSVYVNGKKLEESYIAPGIETWPPTGTRAFLEDNETIRVEEGTYFVLGDNRTVSKDSRYSEVGLVPREDIRGRVFLRYWPINRFGLIGAGEFVETSE
ncbi:signal peptidase I [Candidatus Dojkabacteria bacterium]|uniref:Signal peptidase I n=1 Tax=Candidatus Dojkabacteria bacterium TaxID=2099670 RepID=A0A955RJ56_9BACT|nr:signal peptidase I [Candidatus Dojkabacteria bacterium]